MGLRIIYGKSGSGKSSYCFSEIAKLIDREKNIYNYARTIFFYSRKEINGFSKSKSNYKCRSNYFK